MVDISTVKWTPNLKFFSSIAPASIHEDYPSSPRCLSPNLNQQSERVPTATTTKYTPNDTCTYELQLDLEQTPNKAALPNLPMIQEKKDVVGRVSN